MLADIWETKLELRQLQKVGSFGYLFSETVIFPQNNSLGLRYNEGWAMTNNGVTGIFYLAQMEAMVLNVV